MLFLESKYFLFELLFIFSLNPYISNFRLQFTNESKNEVNKIINEFKEKINNNSNKKYFDSKNNTRGYLKREIL